jgi:hypothetical protein
MVSAHSFAWTGRPDEHGTNLAAGARSSGFPLGLDVVVGVAAGVAA